MAITAITPGQQRAAITGIFKQVDAITGTSYLPELVKEVNSVHLSNLYTWYEDYPEVKEWVGKRDFSQGKRAEHSITNKRWQISEWWYYDEVKDNPEIIAGVDEPVATAIMDHKTLLTMQLLTDNGTCYDGGAFFRTDHPGYQDGVTYSNLQTGSGTTAANIIADYNTYVLNTRLMKKKNGAPLFEGQYEIGCLYPPHLGPQMEENFVVERNEAGATNQYLGKCKLRPTGFLSDTTDYYFYIIGQFMKPFVLQLREPFSMKWWEDADRENRVELIGRARYNAGYGAPQLITKVNNT